MKRILRPFLALSLPLMTLAPLSLNAALDAKIVGADAQWVMHVDLTSLRDSVVGKELVAQATVLQAEAMKGKQFPVQVDLPKLFATIGSITAYGSNLAQDPKLVDGALIFKGTPDLRAIAEGAVAQATITTPDMLTELKDLPFEAYSIHGELIVAFPKEPIILVSKSKTQLLSAYKVFRGDAPSLAKTKNSPLTSLIHDQTGAFVLAASVVPSEKFFPEDAPQARILQMAKSASVELGETAGRTFADVQLLASSDDSADKLMKILQGITAMISLAQSNDQYVSEFLRSVSVAREKNTVRLHAEYSSERLVSMFREFKEEQARGRQRREEQGVERDVASGPVPPVEEKVVLQWKADEELGDLGVSPKTLVSRSVGNVQLNAGATLILTGHRDAGENARFDYLEIAPVSGGAAKRIEAETMTRQNYTVLANRSASGGKLIQAHDSFGTARVVFTGAPGLYTLTVRYVDENDGKSDFFLSVKDASDAVESSEASSASPQPAQPVPPSRPQQPAAPADAAAR